MKADAGASKHWLTVDTNDADLSSCRNGLICWSHVGGAGDLTTLIDAQGASTEATDFSQRAAASERLKGQEPLLGSARQLLAFLVHGMATSTPVVIAAPAAAFDAAGIIGSLLTIVEGLVPRQWSKNLRIRGFTRNPALFLDELKCNLIAVPADLAELVFEVRRDVILLDEHAGAVEHLDVLEAARIYAERTLELACAEAEWLEPVLHHIARVAATPAHLPQDLEAVFDLARILSEGADITSFRDTPTAKIHPALLVEAMLVSGRWQEWRNHSQDSTEFLRRAAMEWCASTFWRTHEADLEDWVQIVRDLGDGLTPDDLEWMTDQEIRSLPFPPIIWFEQEQQGDIERLRRKTKDS